MMTLAELAALIPQSVLHGEPAQTFSQVSTDTRALPGQCLFFALKGERFDAHDFAHEAVAQGAVGLVVRQRLALPVPQIVVPDTRLALGLAAAGWRKRFSLPLITVCGSNGKTTVTQMLASILAVACSECGRLATRGNLNNEIGVPLTLFRLGGQHRAAVIELGMNHPGEIDYLAQLAQPTVALVNNAQREHQEFMGTVEATAHENGASIAALPPDGVAVFPADDPCAPIWRTLAGERKIMDFGFVEPATVRARYTPAPQGMMLGLDTPLGSLEIPLQLVGAHNAHNAAAAATAALAAEIPPSAIMEGLSRFSPVAGRGVIRQTLSGATLIDDTYNANPDSVRAAIDLLAGLAAPRILILGDMGEVGLQGPEFHTEIGAYAREKGLDALLALGVLCQHAVAAFNRDEQQAGQHFADIESLVKAAEKAASAGGNLLVKGSRFMRMERVVQSLCDLSNP